MNNDLIKFSQFKKSLISQPFFIWNSLDESNELKDEKAEDTMGFWVQDETSDYVSESFQEVLARTYSRFDKWLVDHLDDKFDIVILESNSAEDKIEETKKYLDSGKIIIGPHFEFKGALSVPFAFDTKTSKIIDIKYSKKTKRADFIKAFWNYSIVSKSVPVEEYDLYLPVDKKYQKGEIELRPVDRIHIQVSGYIPGSTNAKGEVRDFDVLTTIKSGMLNKKIHFPIIEDSIKKIEEAREVTEVMENLIYDNTDFGTNYQWNELLEKLGHPHFGINGNIIRKKAIVDGDGISSPLWEDIEKAKEARIYNDHVVTKLIDYIDKSPRVLWYDFEGYSLPFSPLNNVAPNAQLVFQVSAIETIKNKEVSTKNIVIDPKTICLDDLFEVINTVYARKADCYVVYNKGYENTRIKEMVELLRLGGHPNTLVAKEMYEWIIANTIDLYEIFAISSKNGVPGIIMHDQKAKASIKNVEKHITKNKIPLPRPITPYKELGVQNGMMAMNLAIERALEIIGDKKWEEKESLLKKYCENDVRAMIMVYDFVKYLQDK